MTENEPTPVGIDEYLSLNKYSVDEENAHIELVDHPDDTVFRQLMLLCPAGLYRLDDDGAKVFDYAGCVECGTCRIVGEGSVVKKWTNPQPTMGVEYRFG